MPKKIWNEKELLPKILELRKKGMSYREIAKNIGCSTFTVSRILSPFENPQSRLKQVVELAEKVDEVFKKVEELASKLKGVEFVEEIGKKLSGLEERISRLEKKLEIIEESAKTRTEDEECKHIDKDGFCTYWYWHERIKGWEMKEVSVKEEKRYYLNVKEHPLMCAACPDYEPKET